MMNQPVASILPFPQVFIGDRAIQKSESLGAAVLLYDREF
jgi:hypothetical protein